MNSQKSCSRKAVRIDEGGGLCSLITSTKSCNSCFGITAGKKSQSLDGDYDFIKSVPTSESLTNISNAMHTIRNLPTSPAVFEEKSASSTLQGEGLVEMVLSFDFTYSMVKCFAKFRKIVKKLLRRFKATIPDIRIAIIAQAGYSDENSFVLQWIDFGASVKELCHFVERVHGTVGEKEYGCLELVLRRTQELSWTPGSQRSLILVGTNPPYERGHKFKGFKLTCDISWQAETKKLKDMDVCVYSLEDVTEKRVPFYRTVAKKTGGRHITFSDLYCYLEEILMAICCREGGDDLYKEYETVVLSNSANMPYDAFEELFAYLEDDLQNKSKPTRRRSAKLASNGKVLSILGFLAPITHQQKAIYVEEGNGIRSLITSLESTSTVGKTASISATQAEPKFTIIEPLASFVNDSISETAAAIQTLRHLVSKEVNGQQTNFSPDVREGNLIEMVFSFDATCSMSRCYMEVYRNIESYMDRFDEIIPGVRVAIIVHGDYSDKDKYVAKWIDFGATVPEVREFMDYAFSTDGYELGCYELALRRTRELSWTHGSQRSLVMVGNSLPHEPGEVYNDIENCIDWRNEAVKLKEMGVRIYSIEEKSIHDHIPIFHTIADITGGKLLPLESQYCLNYVIDAVCHKEAGEEVFEKYKEEVLEEKGTALDQFWSVIFEILSEPKNEVFASPTTSAIGQQGNKITGVEASNISSKLTDSINPSALETSPVDADVETKESKDPEDLSLPAVADTTDSCTADIEGSVSSTTVNRTGRQRKRNSDPNTSLNEENNSKKQRKGKKGTKRKK